jgi:hypothetical protein
MVPIPITSLIFIGFYNGMWSLYQSGFIMVSSPYTSIVL